MEGDSQGSGKVPNRHVHIWKIQFQARGTVVVAPRSPRGTSLAAWLRLPTPSSPPGSKLKTTRPDLSASTTITTTPLDHSHTTIATSYTSRASVRPQDIPPIFSNTPLLKPRSCLSAEVVRPSRGSWSCCTSPTMRIYSRMPDILPVTLTNTSTSEATVPAARHHC